MNKIQLKEHIEKIINYVGQEYNHGPKLVMNESKEPVFISEGMFYHIESNLPLNESIYRPQSAMFLKLFVEARNLYDSKRLTLCEADQYYFDNTDIGKFGIYNGIKVPLDLPLTEEFLVEALGEGTFNSKEHIAIFSGPDGVAESLTEEESSNFSKTVVVDKETSIKGTQFKIGDIVSIQYQFDDDGESFYSIKGYGVNNQNVKILYIPKKEIDSFLKNTSVYLNEAKDKKKDPPIGKPKRGGSKKFYVYVKDKGKVKKVSFGMAGGGLRAKLNNPEARRAFSKRHNCPQKKDRTKASYWSCRLPRYAKLLGFKTTFSGYW